MKIWLLEIMDSPYEEWIRWSIPIAFAVVCTIIKWVKNINKSYKKKNILPWIGKIEGIDKDSKINM